MLLKLNDGDFIGIEVNGSIVSDGCPTCGWGAEQYTVLTLRFNNGEVFSIHCDTINDSNDVEVSISFNEIVRAFTKVTNGSTYFNGTCKKFANMMEKEIVEG